MRACKAVKNEAPICHLVVSQNTETCMYVLCTWVELGDAELGVVALSQLIAVEKVLKIAGNRLKVASQPRCRVMPCPPERRRRMYK
jgi:hypothetical protein